MSETKTAAPLTPSSGAKLAVTGNFDASSLDDVRHSRLLLAAAPTTTPVESPNFASVTAALQQHFSTKNVAELYAQLDTSKNGLIAKPELEAWLKDTAKLDGANLAKVGKFIFDDLRPQIERMASDRRVAQEGITADDNLSLGELKRAFVTLIVCARLVNEKSPDGDRARKVFGVKTEEQAKDWENLAKVLEPQMKKAYENYEQMQQTTTRGVKFWLERNERSSRA